MNHLNSFDERVISYLNQFVRKSWLFDQLVAFVSSNNLLKGGIFMVIVWWAWFRTEGRHSGRREHIIATLLSCIAALALARVLALALPFRHRPVHEKSLDLVLAYGMAPTTLDGYSAFPSDHAVLFFCLAMGLLFISRMLGLMALAYVLVFIALPRMYLGLHYPTDIAAGAMLGMTAAFMVNRYLARTRSIAAAVNFSHVKPSFFYPLFFLMTYQIADMFDSSRVLVSGFFKTLQRIVS